MGLILAIDASTRGCSVALFDSGVLLSASELFADRSSSEMLTTMISQVADQARVALSDLDAIAVARGPGSYTGLRIAVSTAKGLCFGLEKPLLSYNTLKVMAWSVKGQTGELLLCPMLDARRMEVYCAVIEPENFSEVVPTSSVIIAADSFDEVLSGRKVLFFGEGAEKCRPVLGSHPNAVFAEEPIYPSARFAGHFVELSFKEGAFEDVAAFEPFYLKEFMVTKPRKIKEA